jgi:hypothetical protein
VNESNLQPQKENFGDLDLTFSNVLIHQGHLLPHLRTQNTSNSLLAPRPQTISNTCKSYPQEGYVNRNIYPRSPLFITEPELHL